MASLSERIALLQAYYEDLLQDMAKLDDYKKSVIRLQEKVKSLEADNAKYKRACDDLIRLQEKFSGMEKRLNSKSKGLRELEKKFDELGLAEISSTYKTVKSETLSQLTKTVITIILTSAGITLLFNIIVAIIIRSV